MAKINKFDLKKMKFDPLNPEMILQSDVYSKDGTPLAKKGTVIDETNYRRLLRHGVSVVDIYEIEMDVDVAASKPKLVQTNTISPEKAKEFAGFRKEYEKKEKEVEECLAAIGSGAAIDLEKTFELTGGILDKIENKNDVFLYLDFMKEFDDHTFSHCNNVSLLCNVFGGWIGFNEEELKRITVAGILHDVGKTKIPLEILNKPGKFTADEYKIMQQHTTYGYQMLKPQAIPEEMKLSALMHHEKIDGTGYPMGIKGDKINKFSKIVAICDIYDAMTAKRSYHEKMCPFDVIHTFETGLYGALDTEMLLIFLSNIAKNYVGCWGVMSDGGEAEVLFINQKALSRPIVRTAAGNVINLADKRNAELKIIRLK
ncbi:HD-GYP domain-containing protein [Lachnospiraceae bacterium ZAX-1]